MIEQITEYLTLFSGFLTPMIAIIATYIAYQQHKSSKEKFRFDLYEKRFQVYHSIMQLLGSIISTGKVLDEEMKKFLISTSESEFLFEDDIREYLDLIYSKAGDLWHLTTVLEDQSLPIGEERSKCAHEGHELKIWFSEQFKVSRDKFRKYLYFKNK